MITKVEEWIEKINELRADMEKEMEKPRSGDGFYAILNAFGALTVVAECLDQDKQVIESEVDNG